MSCRAGLEINNPPGKRLGPGPLGVNHGDLLYDEWLTNVIVQCSSFNFLLIRLMTHVERC